MELTELDGIDGAPGIDGTNGTNGIDGAPGIDGTNGTNGIDGAPGIDGTNGTNGIDGAPGIDGTNGTNGIDGAPGIDGTNGTNGIDGAPGIDGTNGTNGIDGAPGIDGTNGTNGIDGAPGIDGTNGTNGIDGAPGIDGTNGTNGIDGAPGIDGTNGTNGIDGAPGIDGTNGTNGIDGAPGIDGTNGTNGIDGAPGIDGTNGINGIDGTNGADGIDGADGTNGSDATNYWTEDGSNVYRSSGNVGIGTTTPVSALHVKTTTQFQGIFLDDESGLIAKIARGDATGDPYFKLYSSISGNGVDIQSNGSSYFNGGNVGIGTSSPVYKLDLRGSGDQVINVYSDGTGEAYARFSQNNNTTSGPLMYIGAFGTTPSTFHCGINSRYNFPIKFHQNNITRMTIANGGNVGIGTTTPGHPLHIQGPGTGGQLLKLSGTSNTWLELEADYDGTPQGWGLASYETGSFHFYKRTGTAGGGTIGFKMTITDQGNVGIGTTTPTKKLHITGDGGNDAAIRIQSTNSSGAGFMYMQRNTDGKSYVLNGSNQALILGANNNTSQLYLKENGNVGIGTTAPATKLQVGNGTEQHVWIKTASLAGYYSGIKLTRGNGTWSNNSNSNFGLAVTDNGFSIGKYTDPGSNSTGRSDYLTINAAGNVGIGTTNPVSDLHVAGEIMANSIKFPYGGGWYMNNPNWLRSFGNMAVYIQGSSSFYWQGKYFTDSPNQGLMSNWAGTSNVGLEVANGIVGDWIGANSDVRIKDVIGRSSSKDDLSDLLSIEVTDYKMKDKVKYGEKVTKKVIAQQLKTVFPQAVSLQTKVIPDIYEVSEINEGYIALKTDLKKGDKVKLIFEDDEQTNDELVEVLSTDKNGFTVDNKKEGKVFVFGKQVDDFHVVDYDAVSMLNVSATQELYKLILKQQKTIEKQKEQIDTQKAQVDVQKAQISAQIEKSKKTQSNFDERIKNLEILFNISKLNE